MAAEANDDDGDGDDVDGDGLKTVVASSRANCRHLCERRPHSRASALRQTLIHVAGVM
jgi:hypothetical protein